MLSDVFGFLVALGFVAWVVVAQKVFATPFQFGHLVVEHPVLFALTTMVLALFFVGADQQRQEEREEQSLQD